MNSKQLARGVAEIKGVVQSLGLSSHVTVYSGDMCIHNKQTVFNQSEITIFGGGGTDVMGCIEAMAEERPRYDLIIAITDGLTTWGDTKPRCNLFVINVGCGPRPTFPCKYVHIPEDN